ELLAAFYGARAGHDDEFATADRLAAGVDDRVVRPEVAAREFVWPCDACDPVDAWQNFERFEQVVGEVCADHADDRALLSLRELRFQVVQAQDFDDVLDVLARSAWMHDCD